MESTKDPSLINTPIPTLSKDEQGKEIPNIGCLSLGPNCEEGSNTDLKSADDNISSGQSRDLGPASNVEVKKSKDDEDSDSGSENDAEYDSDDDSDGFEMDEFEYDSDGEIIFEVDVSEEKKKADEAARKAYLKQHLSPIELFIYTLPSVGAKDLPESKRACGVCGIAFEEGDAPDFAVRLPCSHLIGKQCLRDMLEPKQDGGPGKTSCYRCRQPMAIPEE